MSSRDFYNLCYDLYKREGDDTDVIYQRAGVLLIALPILGGVTVKMGRTDILVDCFARVDTFFYYLATSVSLLSVFISAVFLILTVYPRKYQGLASMDVWQKWRGEYQKYSEGKEKADVPLEASSIDEAMIRNMCPKLAEAQAKNAKKNEKRRKYFQRSVLMAAISMVAMSAQALFYFLLHIQGI